MLSVDKTHAFITKKTLKQSNFVNLLYFYLLPITYYLCPNRRKLF